MSDRALRGLMLRLAAGATLALVAAPLAAQDVEYALKVRLDSARARQKVAEAERRAAFRRPQEPIDTSWIDAGRFRIAVVPQPVREVEARALARGVQDGLALLTARHGHRALELVDTVPWHLVGRNDRFAAFEPLLLRAGSQELMVRLERPIDAARVAQVVLEHAGARLRRTVPAITRFIGNGARLDDRARLDDSPWPFEQAGRELAVSWAAPARRCYGGAVADCRRTLAAPDSLRRVETWFDPTDHQAVVVMNSGEIPGHDRARRDQREQCVDGDLAVCSRLAATLAVRYPFSNNLRASFVREAFALGDTLMYDRLLAMPPGDPIEGLAQAAGVSSDSLLSSWARHARGALDATQSSSLLLLVVAVVWSGVFVALAGWRRLA